MSNGKGYVGLDPEQVFRLVKQLEGAVGELERYAGRAQAALERVAHTVPIADGEREVQYLRSIARRLGEMAADADRRRREFEEAQRFESHFNRAESLLGGVSEAVGDHLEQAERWIPGYWKAGEWIPGSWRLEGVGVRVVGPGVDVSAGVLWRTEIPGRFGPRTWVAGHAVPDAALRTAGKSLGRAMNVLDVGLVAWDDWSKYRELPVGERAAHAAWAGATLGVGSAAGGWAGYLAGTAAVGLLAASLPVALPAAGAVAVVAGIGGAIVGSNLGKTAGGALKKGAEAVGRRVAGWFR